MFSFSATDLDVLRVIDHPVLLEIEAADGVRRVVALRQLSDGEAELDGVVEAGPVRVPIEELLNYWLGDAHLVWRDFEPLPDVIRPGDAGDGVVWLQQALADSGFSPGSISGRFDVATVEAVRAFQEDRHLEPDGAVGPLTKMALYRATGRYAVPHVAVVARARRRGLSTILKALRRLEEQKSSATASPAARRSGAGAGAASQPPRSGRCDRGRVRVRARRRRAGVALRSRAAGSGGAARTGCRTSPRRRRPSRSSRRRKSVRAK